MFLVSRKKKKKDEEKDKRRGLILEAAINRGSKQGNIRQDSPGRFCLARRSRYEQISVHDTNLRYGDVRTEITRRGTKSEAEKRSTQAREQRCIIVATNYPCFCTRTIYTLCVYRYTGCRIASTGSSYRKK